MTGRIRPWLALAAPALLAAAGCTGTPYGSAGGSGGVLCHAGAAISLTGGVITGQATASCTVAPTSHRLTVHLLYQTGGAGSPRGTMMSRTSTAIPAPGADVTVQTRHTCLPGTWTVQYLVDGASPDGTPFTAHGETTSGAVSMDDCNRR
jgi:hypothetical protein